MALGREYRSMKYEALVKGLWGEVQGDFGRALRIGCVTSTDLWNFGVYTVTSPVVHKRRREGKGFPFDPDCDRLTHVWWADNLYLLASSSGE